MCENQTDRVLFNDMNRLVSEASFDTLHRDCRKKIALQQRGSSTQIASFVGAPQDTSVEQLFLSSFNNADLEFVKKLSPYYRAAAHLPQNYPKSCYCALNCLSKNLPY